MSELESATAPEAYADSELLNVTVLASDNLCLGANMEWGSCAPCWGSMDAQQEVTLTDVLSNDVLCNVLKHCQPLDGLPLTCRAFRAALRSSGTECTFCM